MFEFDLFANRNPGIYLGSYVDDDTISAYGDEQQVISDLQKAASDLKQVFVSRLGVRLAEDKAVSSASTAKLAKKLSCLLAPSCPSAATNATISLGVDFAPVQGLRARQAVR